ncbi:MAG: DNA-directed RNA polymerase subunit beta [Clostridia bacterium]|nr:DNA-directed RNA polymerase subunit beta [Clostridia bacterium]
MIKVKEQKLGQNTRVSFQRSNYTMELPNLVEIQTKSFKWFLEEGLGEVLRDISPITDFSGDLLIDFVDYKLDVEHPNYPVEECKERDVNYSAPLKASVRLTNRKTGEIKQHDVFMGELPIMTETGTFVINGAERVIVSQIVRSPGMYYDSEIDKAGKKTFSAQVIPYRGAWLEYDIDGSGCMNAKIDKTRKVPITIFLRALEFDKAEDIFEKFGKEDALVRSFERDECQTLAENNNTDAHIEALKEVYKKMRPGEPVLVESAQQLLHNDFFDNRRYDIQPVGRYKFDKKMAIHSRIAGHKAAEVITSTITGEILAEPGDLITDKLALDIEHAAVNSVRIELENGNVVTVLSNNTIEPEYVLGYSLEDCGVAERCNYGVLIDIIREAEQEPKEDLNPDRLKQCEDKIKEMCRTRINELCPKHITREDIYASVSYMLNLVHDVGSLDDIDHLGNRRIRCVGEQLQNQMRIGFTRMDKIVKERMATTDNDKLTPQSLINIRPIVTAIREFFGSSQLSQFMDQNNPLAEMTHKRRVSALGPGGLSRDRASFDVRDVHYTQYGRMCPIETPEGPNIGLISYLSTYARISKYGFIEAPYRKVDKANGRVTEEVEYMTADVEDNYIVAQANEPLDDEGHFLNQRVTVRNKTEIIEVQPNKVDYMDVAPKMVVSVATAMIPFLENDDNSRALMGSNMQKQAVPLMVNDSPIVATGIEFKAAVDSGVIVLAKNAGEVIYVDATKVIILNEYGARDTYELLKFKRTNQGTCFNQRPIVRLGQRVEEGQVIADGPATSNGEISLGKNALIGFMTWEGYNYEDAVLLNERLVRDDVYTSLHIEEYTHEARDTKLGPEEITREVPNVGDDALKDLDAEGIVKIGTEVRAGDILVGKITPKGETELTAEERLLRAIFGEKARETRDTSLKMPHGEAGTVVGIRVFSHSAGDPLPAGVNKVVKVYVAQKRKISVGDKMAGRHGNKGVVSRILPPEDMPFLPDGTPLDIVLNPLGVPSRMNIGQVLEVHLGIAAKRLGWKIMTPVFDGANEKDIQECLKMAGLWRDLFPLENPETKDLYEEITDEEGKPALRLLTPEERNNKEYLAALQQDHKLKVCDGKSEVFDGRTGERFDNPVVVGIMYYLKLHHLVDDKIHARSNGPYSMVTQQPLGGKAQFGGQRFGEMEVWALEAYGAAYTLQEILTVKSDDINGRRKAYEAIIKGQNIPTPGVPESFKVLVKELQSLALNVQVLNDKGEELDLSTAYSNDDEPSGRNRKAILEAINEATGNNVMTQEKEFSGYTYMDESGNELVDEEEDEEQYDDSEFENEYDDESGN